MNEVCAAAIHVMAKSKVEMLSLSKFSAKILSENRALGE